MLDIRPDQVWNAKANREGVELLFRIVGPISLEAGTHWVGHRLMDDAEIARNPHIFSIFDPDGKSIPDPLVFHPALQWTLIELAGAE